MEAPYDLVYAVNEALTVLSWYENLPEEEQPPRHIWWSDELVSDWFRNVKKNRDNNRKTGRRSSYEEADDVPMMSNQMIDRSGDTPVIKYDE